MNGRLRYKTDLYLAVLGHHTMDSDKISEGLFELGIKATPRQVTNFIKQHLNTCIDIIRVDTKTGSSYRNNYRLTSGALNVS